MGYSNHDLAVAFALTAAAGLSTTLGAALVFFPSLHTPQFLGAALAFAAGVMLYVSFVEIFLKAAGEFELHFDELDGVNRSEILLDDYEGNAAGFHTTAGCFFAGVLLTYCIDELISYLKQIGGHEDPPQLFKGMADPVAASLAAMPKSPMVGADEGMHIEAGPADVDADREELQRKKLLKTALIAGAAIILHNFPEGLATFIATAKDPSVGASLAIAIGVHNIPEGVVVAIPILHATGSKWKAFFWGAVSGLAEAVAGGIGWIVLSNSDSDISPLGYGMLFGLVAGMMVYICIKELLPTAHKYDVDDKYATRSCFLGMVVMAVSLSLFVN